MIESALYVFRETTLDRRIEAIVEKIVVSLLETANNEAAKGKMKPVYKAVEKSCVEFSLEVPSMRLYRWRVLALPSRKTSFNTSRLTLSRTCHLQFTSAIWRNSMGKLPSLMRSKIITKVWLALVKMNKLLHRLPWLVCPQARHTHCFGITMKPKEEVTRTF